MNIFNRKVSASLYHAPCSSLKKEATDKVLLKFKKGREIRRKSEEKKS